MNKKVCSNCKQEYLISDFRKSKSTKDGLHSWCKGCGNAASKKYYINNKAKCVERATAWRKKNKKNAKKAREAIARWKKENRPHVLETERKRFQNLRRGALEKIGLLRCVNCGCDKLDLLEINHVNGNGYEERKVKQTTRFYLDIIAGKRNTDDLNILCRPCNSIHYLELLHGKLPYQIEWLGKKSGETKQ